MLKSTEITTPFSFGTFGFNLDASENSICPKGSYGCIFDSKTKKLQTKAHKMNIAYDGKSNFFF